MIYRAVIVDDESYIADSTAVFLRSDCPWDMEIQVFYDPREALESIRSQKTDIVITDIRMPEVDGLEMLRQVSEFWPMCQVILLTAHAQFEYVYQAVGRPSADYVLKQDGYEALLAAVNGENFDRIECAAEIALEHHLGLSCDPVDGYVQIPCIERNAVGAVTAWNAWLLASAGDPAKQKVGFDEALAAMYQTGRSMNPDFKETSRGGLAVCTLCC